MFSRLAKFLMVATSAAPVLLTFSFERWQTDRFVLWGRTALIVTIGLCAICTLLLAAARRQLEVFAV